MSEKDTPAWMVAGKKEAGAVADAQVKTGNIDPKSAVATSEPIESIVAGTQEPSAATQQPAKVSDEQMIDAQTPLNGRKGSSRVDSKEQKSRKSMSDIIDGASFVLKSKNGISHAYFREGDSFYLESERNKPDRTDQTATIQKRLSNNKWKFEEVTLAAPTAPDAAQLEKETKERTLAVSGAQTPEELCDIVASFDTVPSIALGDTPGGELASHMRMLLAGLSSRFDTYKTFEEAWKKQYTKVTRVYGVQEKFDVLLKEKMRLKFSESATVPDLKKETEKWKSDVNNAKTLDELYAVVASFEKIASTDRRADISGAEAVEDMKKKIEELSKLTSEDIAVEPTLIYAGVLEYGVNDKFKELVLEMVRQKEKIEKPDEAKDLEKIKVLEEQLVAARTAYAKKDYEETGVWKRLRGILSFSKDIESQKAETEKALYQGKLRELLDAKLKLLKQSGKEGDELKQAMAAELQYFSIESKIKLYDAWTATKDEGSFMKIGKAYNGLVKKHPWISAGIGVSLMAA
ncbi:MAG: hypothetical protein KA034_01190, partial [Candidatus Moranbacteria bacterium]|nr:hypothetical protein [Candidatus Moranbacteria bacterium]